MIPAALIGAGVQAGAGVLGYLLSMPDRQKAEQIINSALDEYGQLDVPALEAIVAQEVGPSAMEQIRTDPRLRDAQQAVLDRLERAATEGLSLEDKVAQNEALRAGSRQESAGRQRIAEDFAARGQLGSGAQLAMQLQNQQGAADRASQVSMQTAANSQRRMYDAMLARGQLAGNLRNQEFGEQERIAQARDAVARYNAGARQQAAAQNIANQQWTYGQRANLAANRLGAASQRAGIYTGRAQNTANLFGAIGSLGSQGFQLGGRYLQDQQQDDQQYGSGPLAGAMRRYY